MKTNPWMISSLLLIGLVVGFGVAQIPYVKNLNAPSAPQGTALQNNQAAPQQAEKQPQLSADLMKKLPGTGAVIGDANAPITLVEFSDFQCPYCSRFFAQTLPQIEENYINTGKVKLIYRNWPLDFHEHAMDAAIAGECAHAQDKFKEMHDKLFTEQNNWVKSTDVVKVFKGYAKDLGLDTTAFNTCVDTKKPADQIKTDLADGTLFGVTGTPGFFLNGKEISGAMPFDSVFKPAIDAELAGKEWILKTDQQQRPYIQVAQ